MSINTTSRWSEFLELPPPPPPARNNGLNYLLVIPNQSDTDREIDFFPIGIAYISSALKVSGRNVIVLNLIHNDKTVYNNLREVIEKNSIDVVMTGGLSAQYKKIKEIIDAVKQINPEIKVVVGGGLITSDPVHAMMALETADYGIVGEGEITSCALAYALETDSDVCNVGGIVFSDGEQWITSAPRAEIANLDIIPWPDYEGCGYEYSLTGEPQETSINVTKGDRSGFISFGRSCPFNCTFCFHTSGSKYRQRSLDSFFEELDWVIKKYNITYLYISDELLFREDNNKVDEFCRRINIYGIRWTAALRVDGITRDLVKKMKNSGCAQVSLGLESANNTVLKSMRKHITNEHLDNALSICAEAGMDINGNFIFGDLAETFSTAMDTIHWFKAHLISSYIRMFWIITYPGSHLYKVACEQGLITDPVQFIKDECPIINVSKMTFEERLIISDEISFAGNTAYKKLAKTKLNLEGLSIDIEGFCPSCGQYHNINGAGVFPSLFPARCFNCGRLLSVCAINHIDIDILKNNIEKLIAGHMVVVYPVTYTIVSLFKTTQALSRDNVFIVDSSKDKQGQMLLGRVIQAPDIIAEKNIDTILISSVSERVINEITKDIITKYPSVHTIKCVGELCMHQIDCAEFRETKVEIVNEIKDY